MKCYFQNISSEEEAKLIKLREFLQANNLAFYTIAERNEGNQKYIDINISIKLA